jgi:hypothetical protein
MTQIPLPSKAHQIIKVYRFKPIVLPCTIVFKERGKDPRHRTRIFFEKKNISTYTHKKELREYTYSVICKFKDLTMNTETDPEIIELEGSEVSKFKRRSRKCNHVNKSLIEFYEHRRGSSGRE